jgi:lauroyl/myristoyl acyltransferase
MDVLFYPVALALVTLLRVLPLTWVARLGRMGGAIAYWLDGRHRRVARRNLTLCFGAEKSPAEIEAIARENFRRIGENFASAVKTASMSLDRLKPHMTVAGAEKMLRPGDPRPPGSQVIAIGHFGNFEMFARAAQLVPGLQAATTYRGLNSPLLDGLLLSLREKNGCLFFERRRDGPALRAAMTSKPLLLGLLSDQHSGDHGARLPFFGRDCGTSKAPAVFAMRYQVPLYTAICFRTSLAHWRIELGDRIPTEENGKPRSAEEIMLDVNQAFEAAVRRDPANWFWVHNRWKPARKAAPAAVPRTAAPAPEPVDDGGAA